MYLFTCTSAGFFRYVTNSILIVKGIKYDREDL